jgi:L-2-hydroxycarboxylate dehydrogenase (NAD+)
MASSARFAHGELETFAAEVLIKAGLPTGDAGTIAASLVHADLIGVSTHGVARLPSYIERLRKGMVNPQPDIKVERKTNWSAAIDADNAMGAVVAQRAVTEVRAMMEQSGIGSVVVRGSNHFGTAGYYARAISGDDGIGICMSPASKSLAPFGSQEPLLGTNPYAVSAPAGRYSPWTMDMASSIAARGHIRIAAKEGKSIPEGWALDHEGRPTTDPDLALKGVMLPFAGSKGSALAMMIDIFGGVMSGSAFAGGIRDMNFDFEAPQNVGHFFMGWKIASFIELPAFNERMETLIGRLKALKPAAGFSEVMYPGEPEAKALEKHSVTGVLLKNEIAAGLGALGDELGVAFPAALPADHGAVPQPDAHGQRAN